MRRTRLIQVTNGLLSIWLIVALTACQPDLQTHDSEPQSTDNTAPFFLANSLVGLDFEHDNGRTQAKYMPEIMGAGGALFDFDQDGDLDLYLVQGGPINGENNLSDRLYRNDLFIDAAGSRNLSFTDITAEAGIPTGDYGMGVASGDYDRDGFVDLYISNFGEN